MKEFVQKIVALSAIMMPEMKSKESRISTLTGEKNSVVKNWLFHNALPPEKKKLKVADSLGVSKETLYNDNQHLSPPHAIADPEMETLNIPLIHERHLQDVIDQSVPLHVCGRHLMSIRNKFKEGIKNIHQIYCFEAKILTYPPYIFTGDIIIFSLNIEMNSNFKIYKDGNLTVLARESENHNELLSHTGLALMKRKNITLLPVLIIISDGR